MARVLFRCDVSPETGTGHLRRCVSLALELKNSGVSVFFACRCKDFNVAEELVNVADDWVELDWLLEPKNDVEKTIELYRRWGVEHAIVDHYRADESYQKKLFNSGVSWMQFAGVHPHPLWADWVLDASPAASNTHYAALKRRAETKLLLGPKYALLRREFREVGRDSTFHPTVRTIVITLGGGDDRGATIFSLQALSRLSPTIERIVLASKNNPRVGEIVEWIQKGNSPSTTLLMDSSSIALAMKGADLIILGGGTTSFEAAALGIPSVIIQIADNQKSNARAWAELGVALDTGPLETLAQDRFESMVVGLIQSPERRNNMATAGVAHVDGMGTQRVARTLLSGK